MMEQILLLTWLLPDLVPNSKFSFSIWQESIL